MVRYAVAVIGFCLISVAYSIPAAFVLYVIIMSHCSLSDAQIANGETCTQPGEVLFWPVTAVLAIQFIVIQWLFLRWALRRRPT